MLYRVKRDDGLSGSQWGVLAGAFLSILFIFQVTAQQIDGDRRRAIESEIHQNQARTQIFQQYVLRTLEMAKVATDQLATRLEAGDISTADGARGIVDTSFLPKMNYVEGVAVSFGDRDHLLTGPRSLSLSNWRALRKFALAQPTDAAITPPFTAIVVMLLELV